MSTKSHHQVSVIATIERAKLRVLRDELARAKEGKARKRVCLERAEQMEFAWERACLGVTPLRVRR